MKGKNIAIIEGILFLSGSEGVSLKQIKSVLGIKTEACVTLLELYREQLDNDEYRGVTLRKFGEGYKLVTKPEHREYYEELVDNHGRPRLSKAALETLAVIAYNAPITRTQIESIRGLSSDGMLRKLMIKGLIEEVGRSETPGKPILFNVTPHFLDHFGITSVDELPKINKPVEDDVVGENIFDTKYTEE